MSEEAKSFIRGLLQLDPNNRMNIEQMKEHAFLSDRMVFVKAKELTDRPADEEDIFEQKSSAFSDMELKRRETQMVKRLNEKLRGA